MAAILEISEHSGRDLGRANIAFDGDVDGSDHEGMEDIGETDLQGGHYENACMHN